MDTPWKDEYWAPGVLSPSQVKTLIDSEFIIGKNQGFEEEIDNSSFDLHITDHGFRMKYGSIKPCGERYDSFFNNEFAEKLEPNSDGHFELIANNCYVFLLRERFSNIKFDAETPIYGQATAKSSIGRLDVIARLIVDGMYQYEAMDSKYLGKGSGKMYLEITPITFNIKVKDGVSLSQLRLFYGRIEESIITNKVLIQAMLHGCKDDEGTLSVDLTNTNIQGQEAAAFRALKKPSNDKFINLFSGDDKPNPKDFWEIVPSINTKSGIPRLKIEKDYFYIIRSKERISLPKHVAVYCRAMDEAFGEMRIHYAGFVHPLFGLSRKDAEKGTPLIFEVRGHNVDVSLQDREKLAKLNFYRLSQENYDVSQDETYNNQELTLSKFFGDWPK